MDSFMNQTMIEAFEKVRVMSTLLDETCMFYNEHNQLDDFRQFSYISHDGKEVVFEYYHSKELYNVYVITNKRNIHMSEYYEIDEYYEHFKHGFWKWIEVVTNHLVKER